MSIIKPSDPNDDKEDSDNNSNLPSDNESGNTTHTDDESKDSVNTGVTSGLTLYGIATAISGLGLFTFSKKRKAKK